MTKTKYFTAALLSAGLYWPVQATEARHETSPIAAAHGGPCYFAGDWLINNFGTAQIRIDAGWVEGRLLTFGQDAFATPGRFDFMEQLPRDAASGVLKVPASWQGPGLTNGVEVIMHRKTEDAAFIKIATMWGPMYYAAQKVRTGECRP